MKKLIVLMIIFPTLLTAAWAQLAVEPITRQFFFNPYLYNASFVGINKKTELNLLYRKQWMNIKDSPTTMGLNFQYPTSNDRVILGMTLISDSQLFRRNSTVMGTFGYVVPIEEKQALRFGLSGGVGLNRISLTVEELNTSDPAIVNALGNNYYVNGNFGFVYTHSGLRLGLALTELFNNDPLSSENFNKFSMSNLKNRLYSLSYRMPLDRMDNFSLEPHALYRQSSDGLQDAWEVASVLYYRQQLWTGLNYHQYRGLGIFFGLQVIERFRFSYNYEFPPFRSAVAKFSSHELQLSFFPGKLEP